MKIDLSKQTLQTIEFELFTELQSRFILEKKFTYAKIMSDMAKTYKLGNN